MFLYEEYHLSLDGGIICGIPVSKNPQILSWYFTEIPPSSDGEFFL